ncbi:sensor histidine kinase [Streptomyces sp. 6N106]|uniref:sensor histidine kinase n=1 Tax=Streptomyces sp. 6N106 TaxID=3457418 RepID=UPI003FD1BE8D
MPVSDADTSEAAWSSLIGCEVVTLAVLVLRRRLPVTAFVVSLGALVVALVGSAAEDAKLTPLAFLPLAVLIYHLGIRCTSWMRTVLAMCAGGVMTLAGLWVNRTTAGAGEFRGGADVLAVLAPMPLAWTVGFAARTRHALLVAAERRAADADRAQRLRAAQAAQRERARIAREMHDVVAHSLTLLVVHAETLRARGDELPGWARAQVDSLAAAGRQTGGELRDLLRILRAPTDAAPLQPMPGLDGLDALLDSHRAAGGRVEVRIRTELESLPSPVQLAGYRIVQESLANARRHAPGAPLGMKDTFLSTNADFSAKKTHATGYEPDAQRLRRILPPELHVPKGTAFAGPAPMATPTPPPSTRAGPGRRGAWSPPRRTASGSRPLCCPASSCPGPR